MRKLLVVLIALVLSACSTVKYIPIDNKVDSIVVEKIVERVDTIAVYLPDQSKEISVQADSSHLETDYATSNAWVDTLLILHHNLQNKPQIPIKKEIVYKDKIIEKEVIKNVEVPIEVKVPEKYIPSFFKFCLWWFIGSIVLIGLWVLWKIKLSKS